MRAVRALLVGGLGLTLLGGVLLGRAIGAYLASSLAASSTSGVRVFRMPDGTLGGYEPFVLGTEPLVMGVGLLLVVSAVLLGTLQPAMSRTRASTAGSNADAQMR